MDEENKEEVDVRQADETARGTQRGIARDIAHHADALLRHKTTRDGLFSI